MPKTLTENELKIRHELAVVRRYPRWKYMSFTKGFCLYTTPTTSDAEVFKHRDGRWSAGSVYRGTLCYFDSLQDALFYAERLVNLPFEIRRTERGVLQSRHAPIVIGDAAAEEKARRDGVMLTD